MNNVNKTLYIPLYGKAYVSKRGLFLKDNMAEEIWERECFLLKGKSSSKWLAYYMGIRSAVFDEWLRQEIVDMPSAVVIHIGCGLDSRVMRLSQKIKWYDIDFPAVISERKRYYKETDSYQMIEGDVRESSWLELINENGCAIVVLEGVSMYLTTEEMQILMANLSEHFEKISLLADSYTKFGAKMSKRKNPINDVGVTKTYGIDDPREYQSKELLFKKEQNMTPSKYINELKGFEKFIFSNLYAGALSKKLYRLYEYRKN